MREHPVTPGATERPSADAAEPPIFDPEAAMIRLDGDVELFAMLEALYQQDSDTLFQQLRDAHARGDAREVQRAAHSLKGLAANFDGFRASGAAAKIETLAKDSNLDGVAKVIPDLEFQIAKLREVLANYTP